MDQVFPLTKKNSEKFDSSRWGLTLGTLAVIGILTWLGNGGQGSRWWNFFGCCLSWIAIVFKAVMADEEWYLLLDTYKERVLKWVSTLLGFVGYTLGFVYNLSYTALYNRSHYDFGEEAENAFISLGLLFQRSPLEAIIFVGALLIFVICFLKVLRAIAKGYKDRRCQIKHALLAVGPDGKKYRVPMSLDTAFEILDKVEEDKSIPLRLVQERVGDLMYEDFKADRWGWWSVKRPSGIEGEKLSGNPQFLWVHKVEEIYSKIILFRLNHQQYDKAKQNVDRLMEIAKKRNWKYEGKTTLYQALELHRLVYARIPDNEKDPSVEAKYEKLWQREKADYDTWVKAAPARRAAAEKAMQEIKLEAEYQEAKRQIRAEKEAKLRHQYEEKTKEVDDWFNAIASAQDGTVYSDWHDSRIPVDGVDADTYRRREFLRDEKKDQYRKEYEEALRELDDDE